MALYPGFINKLPDVLKNKTVFDWIVGGDSFIFFGCCTSVLAFGSNTGLLLRLSSLGK